MDVLEEIKDKIKSNLEVDGKLPLLPFLLLNIVFHFMPMAQRAEFFVNMTHWWSRCNLTLCTINNPTSTINLEYISKLSQFSYGLDNTDDFYGIWLDFIHLNRNDQ